MNIGEIRRLIKLLKETGVGEIEIQRGEESVRISLLPSQVGAGHMPTATHTVGTPQPTVAVVEDPHRPVQSPAVPGHHVKSPMVGTVYLASAPGEKPFVEIGQRVEMGQTVCVIEAMKMYNQIEADKAGVIRARLVENGSPVEYDQPLFIIED